MYDKNANVMDIEEYIQKNTVTRQEDNYEVISVTAAPFDVKEEVKDKLEILSNELSDDELKYAIIALAKNLEAREEDEKFLDIITETPDNREQNFFAKQFDDEGAQYDENTASY